MSRCGPLRKVVGVEIDEHTDRQGREHRYRWERLECGHRRPLGPGDGGVGCPDRRRCKKCYRELES